METSKKADQLKRIELLRNTLQKRSDSAIRPYRADGFVNVLSGYGTEKDPSERFTFTPEPMVPDAVITSFYEGNGLFAKIIDTPAEEAVKHGFYLKNVSDEKINAFWQGAVDELLVEENIMTALKWARLYGGSIAVLLVNDGRGIDEPLDWSRIKSIDDIRVYERSIIQPDYSSMFSYDPRDPFKTRGSRLGMPEYYYVNSRFGNFVVHESRCLVFQNGKLPENCSNTTYQLWGMPEYVRLRRAIQDAELAHRSAPKMIDRAVQAVYKMKGLSELLSAEGGEQALEQRIQTIDLCRSLLNTMVIDYEGEDYEFKTMTLAGISEAVSSSCEMLSAISNIPQSILFGIGAGGMSTTDDTSMENYYNYVERIQKRMLRGNLRYLISVILQAGIATGEVEEIPDIDVEFNPLWSMSDNEKADLESKKAATQQTKANTAQIYVNMNALDPSEVRKKLADSGEFDVETIITEDDIKEEDLFEGIDLEGENKSEEAVDPDPDNAPQSAPAATKLPQDMSELEQAQILQNKLEQEDSDDDIQTPHEPESVKGVGILVVKGGKILCGRRHNDTGYGLWCGPGGKIDPGENAEQAAFRETEEEFSISPKELIPLGYGPAEPGTGWTPKLFLCTEYEGEPAANDLEITGPQFKTLAELEELSASLFQPFKSGIEVLKSVLFPEDPHDPHNDGGPGSGNFGHEGVPEQKSKEERLVNFSSDGGEGSGNWGHEGVEGQLGGSAPGGGEHNRIEDNGRYTSFSKERAKLSRPHVAEVDSLQKAPTGTICTVEGSTTVLKKDENGYFVSQKTGEIWDPEELQGITVRSFIPKEANPNVRVTEKVSKKRVESCFRAREKYEAHERFVDTAKQAWDSMSSEEQKAIRDYTGWSYEDVNRALRTGDTHKEKDRSRIDLITSAISKCKIEDDAYLYRGMDSEGIDKALGIQEELLESIMDGELPADALVGKTFRDKGFMSCGSSCGSGFKDKAIRAEIFVPKGTEAFYAEPVSKYGKATWDKDCKDFGFELETILNRGTVCKVIGAEMKEGQLQLRLQVVAQSHKDNFESKK